MRSTKKPADTDRRAGKRALTAEARRKRDAGLFRSLADVPMTLTVDDVIAVYRRSRTTILREVRAGIFSPPPFDTRPYRWRKEDVARDLEQRAAAGVRESRKKIAEQIRAANT